MAEQFLLEAFEMEILTIPDKFGAVLGGFDLKGVPAQQVEELGKCLS